MESYGITNLIRQQITTKNFIYLLRVKTISKGEWNSFQLLTYSNNESHWYSTSPLFPFFLKAQGTVSRGALSHFALGCQLLSYLNRKYLSNDHMENNITIIYDNHKRNEQPVNRKCVATIWEKRYWHESLKNNKLKCHLTLHYALSPSLSFSPKLYSWIVHVYGIQSESGNRLRFCPNYSALHGL